MADLTGKVALIVDGRGALGAGIRKALSEAGATVCMAHDEALPEAGMEACCQRVVDAHGRLDLLVNDVCGAGARPGHAGAPWEHPAGIMVGQGRGLIVNLGNTGPGPGFNPGDGHGGMLSRVDATPMDRVTAEMARQLGPHGVVALALHAAAPLYTGRCIAALAMDPDIAEKAGGSYRVARLAGEYRFSDPAMDD